MRVPNEVVDNKPVPFPQGTYVGEIAETEERWVSDGQTMFLRVVFANNTPADTESPEVGNRTHREDLCMLYNGDSLFDHDEITPETPFLFRRSAGLLASLAAATGHADRGEEDTEFNAQAYKQLLAEGQLTGERVKFQVRHRTRTRKDTGEEITEAETNKFGPAN